MAPNAGEGRVALWVVAGVVALAAIIVALRYLLAPSPSTPVETPTPIAGEDAAPRLSPWERPSSPATSPAPEPGPSPVAPRPTPGVASGADRDVVMAAARGDAAAGERLAEALQAGDPRAYAYSALYCVPGSGCDPAPGDRAVALAASQVRAGLAIRSGDPEAIYHGGLAIAHRALGRNLPRGAAWMLVACRRGYNCVSPGELDRAWPCGVRDEACRAATTVEDRLQSVLGPGGFARAYALADEFSVLLDSGDVPESAVTYGNK